jgi:hypothetical protein
MPLCCRTGTSSDQQVTSLLFVRRVYCIVSCSFLHAHSAACAIPFAIPSHLPLLLSTRPCQTPTLGFCVERHDVIVQFKPEPFWTVVPTIDFDSRLLKLTWERGRVFDHGVGVYFESVVGKEKRARYVWLLHQLPLLSHHMRSLARLQIVVLLIACCWSACLLCASYSFSFVRLSVALPRTLPATRSLTHQVAFIHPHPHTSTPTTTQNHT